MSFAALAQAAERYHLIAVLPLVAALVFGPLATRWLRRLGRARGAAASEAVERAAHGSLWLLIALIAIGWAVSLVPEREARWAVFAQGALFVAAVLVAGRLVVRVLRAAIAIYLESAAGPQRERAQRDYLPLASSLTTVAVGLAVAIVIARHFGYDVTSLVAALGIGSLAIGLAAQQTLGNMIAGFTLLVDRPFRPGDRIRLATGEIGQVHEIGIRSTRILLDDENVLIAPNAELANSRVVNFAYPTARGRGEVRVKLPAAVDVDRFAEQAVAEARAQPEVQPEPAPEVVLVGTLDPGGGAEIAVRFHVPDGLEVPLVEARLRRALWRRLRPS